MSTNIQEGNLSFDFEFSAIKFDDSQYYRKHFIGMQKGLKAVDILAVNNNIGYLIEIKDYTYPDTKNIELKDLINAIVNKVISTLAAILPMKNNASFLEEKNIAHLFSQTEKINIFLHIELPPPSSKLKQSTWKFSTITSELKRKLKPIDAHPKVVSKKYSNHFPWIVS